MNIEESIRLAAGKADLAEEMFSMLLEQLPDDRDRLVNLWEANDREALQECVHKLYGATRYCGVPELRQAAGQLETALRDEAAEAGALHEQLLAAIDRLQAWSERTDWQRLFREQQKSPQESGP